MFQKVSQTRRRFSLRTIRQFLSRTEVSCNAQYVMETIIPPTKTRKPRTTKTAAPHVAAIKKAMSAALKAEHAFSIAASRIEAQIAEIRTSLESKRAAALAAWREVEARAAECASTHGA